MTLERYAPENRGYHTIAMRVGGGQGGPEQHEAQALRRAELSKSMEVTRSQVLVTSHRCLDQVC